MKKTFPRFVAAAVLVTALVSVTSSCSQKKFHINGTVTEAKDSVLYLEHNSLSGFVKVDSVKLDEKGQFEFTGKTASNPEFYRLRIAGQIINVSIDSTETVTVAAAYPDMAAGYEVKGSENCSKIRELTLMQMELQHSVNQIAMAPELGVEAVGDSIQKKVEAYKNKVKMEYIFKEPMKAYAYFALFQTISLGRVSSLIFNPRSSEEDVKVFAAVATSWDSYYPGVERGQNLHNIAIEGMKNIRIMRSKASQTISADKVDLSGVLDISLADNKGNVRTLSSLKGKVVLLDFHLFAGEGSLKRIMAMRDVYNKYHAQGLEIYQVSVDADEHFWKTQTAALPWISVRATDETNALQLYNVQAVPTFFLLDRDNVVHKRDVQISDLDAEIKSLL